MQRFYIASNNPPYDRYVEFIQRELNNLKGTLMLPEIYPVDGKYGPQTAKTVIVFQRRCGITADGIWGEQSRNALAQQIRQRPVNPSIASRELKWDMSYAISGAISKIADLFKTVCDTALEDVKTFAQLKKAPQARDIELLAKKCFKNNASLLEVKRTLEKLWENNDALKALENAAKSLEQRAAKAGAKVQPWRMSHKDIQLSKQATFERIQAKQMIAKGREGLAKAGKAFDQALSRYAKRMQSQPFMNMIKQGTAKPKVKGGGWLMALSIIPLVVDIIAIIVYACHGWPLDEWVERLFKDLCDFVEGILIGLLIGAIVAAVGLTGGWAILVVLALSVLVSFIYWIANSITNRDNHLVYDVVCAAGSKLMAMFNQPKTQAVPAK